MKVIYDFFIIDSSDVLTEYTYIKTCDDLNSYILISKSNPMDLSNILNQEPGSSSTSQGGPSNTPNTPNNPRPLPHPMEPNISNDVQKHVHEPNFTTSSTDNPRIPKFNIEKGPENCLYCVKTHKRSVGYSLEHFRNNFTGRDPLRPNRSITILQKMYDYRDMRHLEPYTARAYQNTYIPVVNMDAAISELKK
jgi:hypothetical protein